MTIPVITLPPLTADQANPWMSGINSGLNTYQNFIRSRYANQMAQAQLAYQQAQAPYMKAQTSEITQGKIPFEQAQTQGIYQGQIPLQQAQAMAQRALPSLYAAQAASAYSDVPLHQAQAGYYNVQSQLDPYRVAASMGALPGLVAGAQLVNQYMPQASAALGVQFGGGGQAPANSAPRGAANVNAPPQSIALPMNGGAPTQSAPPMANSGGSFGYPTYAQAPSYPGAPAPGMQGQVSPPMGGGASGQPGAPGAVPQNLWQMQLHNLFTGMSKNPAFGSNKSGAGGTFFNPANGDYYTTDTEKNTSVDQNTIAAIQRVSPLLENLTQSLPQFQGFGGKVNLVTSQVLNSMFPGLNLQAPAQYAQGQTDINLAGESLVKAMGINPTDQNLAAMKEAIEPHFGENSAQYRTRILSTLTDLYRNQGQAVQRLKAGIPLGAPPGQSSTASTHRPDPFEVFA